MKYSQLRRRRRHALRLYRQCDVCSEAAYHYAELYDRYANLVARYIEEYMDGATTA